MTAWLLRVIRTALTVFPKCGAHRWRRIRVRSPHRSRALIAWNSDFAFLCQPDAPVSVQKHRGIRYSARVSASATSISFYCLRDGAWFGRLSHDRWPKASRDLEIEQRPYQGPSVQQCLRASYVSSSSPDAL